MNSGRVAVAVDIGGTSLRVATIDSFGRLHGEVARRPMTFDADGHADVNAVLGAIEPPLAEARRIAGKNLPVGVSLCGNVDADTGHATLVPNLGWRHVPFGRLASARLGTMVRVCVDTQAAGLAEAIWGVGRRVSPFLWVTLGTGFGSCLVVDGLPYRGAHGYAGLIGHTSLDEVNGRVCGCGRRGCVETIVAGPAIVRAGQEAAVRNPRSMIAALAGAAPVTAAHVFQAFLARDPEAVEIVDDVADVLASSLASAVNLLDPSLIVLGGGVVGGAPWLVAELDRRIRPRLQAEESRRDLRLATESFPDSPLWGAAAFALGYDSPLAAQTVEITEGHPPEPLSAPIEVSRQDISRTGV